MECRMCKATEDLVSDNCTGLIYCDVCAEVFCQICWNSSAVIHEGKIEDE